MELINKNNEREKNILKLIPLYELYMEYMVELIIKLPRTEKFSIGTEFKNIMYEAFRNIMYIEKVESKNRLYYLNKIDADLNVQRVLLRIMKKNKWISEEKFKIVITTHMLEIGKNLGGLIKYYAKDNKK